MIPNELRGKKAVPFLEYCYKIKEEHTKEDLQGNTKAINNALFKIYEGMRFYSLPFDVSMLVGDNAIFEGWEKYPNGDMILKADNKIALSYDGHNKHLTNYYNEFGESQSWKVKSLNDFITLCNLSEINLTFKK